MKNRIVRKELMEQVIEVKNQFTNVMSILREAMRNGRATSTQIAKLND